MVALWWRERPPAARAACVARCRASCALSARGWRGGSEGERGVGGAVSAAACERQSRALLTVARAMLEKATAQKELFVSRGMSPMLLDALAGALASSRRRGASREGRRNHVGASADLKAVAAEIKSRYTCSMARAVPVWGERGADGAWASARNVLGRSSPRLNRARR